MNENNEVLVLKASLFDLQQQYQLVSSNFQNTIDKLTVAFGIKDPKTLEELINEVCKFAPEVNTEN